MATEKPQQHDANPQSANQNLLAQLVADAMQNPALAAAMAAYGRLAPYVAYGSVLPTFQVSYATGGNA